MEGSAIRELLDELARQCGCLYLSDLRYPPARPALLRVLNRCPAEDYPAAQWTEALSYLAGQPNVKGTPEELRAQLYRALSGP